MRIKLNNMRKKETGKTIFFWSLLSLFSLVAVSLFLQPTDVKNCDQSVLLDCGCPIDRSSVDKKSIILIDATNIVPQSKLPDIEELILSFTKPNEIFTWLVKGKKVDKTSIYVLNSDSPVEMLPIASFCQLPPDIAFKYFGNFNGKQIIAIHKSILLAVSKSINQVKKFTASKTSEIIRTIAATSSNGKDWRDGSKYVVVSDLYENSSGCGFFDKSPVMPFASIPQACKKLTEEIAKNISDESATIALCRIQSKDIKLGMKEFWDEVFLNASGRKPLWTCDANKINDRASYLENSK